MERDDKMIMEQLRLLELQFSDDKEKKERVMRLIHVYLKILKRCPHLAQMPKEEQKELIRILKECDVI